MPDDSQDQIIELRAAKTRIVAHCDHTKAAVGKLSQFESDALAVANWLSAMIATKQPEATAASPQLRHPTDCQFRPMPAATAEEPKMAPGAVRPPGSVEPPGPDMVTDDQLNELRQLCIDKGIGRAKLNGWLSKRFKHEDVRRLTMIEADSVIDGVKKYQPA